jgi:uncharacterized membrane protein (DUF2068 family)
MTRGNRPAGGIGGVPDSHVGLRTIALFEAAKGLVVLLAGSGLLLLVHRDVQAMAEQLVSHLHLNPAKRYPRIFLHLVTEATPTRLRLLALGALVYSAVRFAEAYGLWHARRWAEWMGLVTGVVYIPFEARAWIRHPGLEPAVAVAVNLGIVVYLALRLRSPADEPGDSVGAGNGA